MLGNEGRCALNLPLSFSKCVLNRITVSTLTPIFYLDRSFAHFFVGDLVYYLIGKETSPI